MCDKTVDIYLSTIKFVPEWYRFQQIYYKAIFDFIPDQYKTKEICDIVASLYPFLIAYYPEKYKWMWD